jgi:hypothetical protein
VRGQRLRRLEAAIAHAYLAPRKEGEEMSALIRFLGDSPLRVALKLIVLSFLVGVVMSAFGWSPFDILAGIREFLAGIWNMGFRAVERFFGYFLLGAAVVVPAFVILRLLSFRRS